MNSHTTVVIPFYNRVIIVGLLNGAEFAARRSEVAQKLHAISGIQFLVGGTGLGERWLLGTFFRASLRDMPGVVGELYAI